MKLRTVRLHGFKSFPDPTEIEFHEGITAIVGPNGCGKSNISDAIRWVLGEQRPSAIRGARMDEAIFQGTVHRRPVNRASVSLVVSNEDGLLPVPYEEVEISRTVYREGGSEYAINRNPCRLRDVLDLCRDTGLGANAYAVIEARMIDAILSDRAEERRALFEEAAGIGKYKDRRKATLRRLEAAEVDLARLEDVIAEVASKVRSLARQKGRAERYGALRQRRLSLEVAVARHELGLLEERLAALRDSLTGWSDRIEALVAELRSAEAAYEELRLEAVEAERRRGEALSALEAVRDELAGWDRDLAVARERSLHAERRLGRLREEREEVGREAARLADERAALEARREALTREAGEVEAALAEARGRSGELRVRLAEVREELAALEDEERALARERVELEGEEEAAQAQAEELLRHRERLRRELEAASTTLSELDAQGDLFADRLDRMEGAVGAAGGAVEEARARVAEARERLREAVGAEREAVEEAAALRARVEALAAVARSGEGLDPAVAAVLALDDPSVAGTLAEFVTAEPAVLGALEGYLGPLLQGLVVRDLEGVARLRRWFETEWEGRGGLVLLPLPAVPESPPRVTLPPGVAAEGEGAPWVTALLGGIGVEEGGEPDPAGGPRLSPAGWSVDERGVVRMGRPGGGGILERRVREGELREAVRAAERGAEEARRAREVAEEELGAREEALREAEARLREAEDERRTADAEAAARTDHRERVERQRRELARLVEGAGAARERALERAARARREREAIEAREGRVRERREGVVAALRGLEEEWERARGEEERLSVRAARLEGEVEGVEGRLGEVEEALRRARERGELLEQEEEELLRTLREVSRLQEEGRSVLDGLFRRREEAERAVREREGRYESVTERVSEAEARVRAARGAEREASEERHRLELEAAEVGGRIARIRERLEGEWGRPFQRLVEEAEPVAGAPEELRRELEEVVAALDRIGPVNLLAVEEHEEERRRLEFLRAQREDLVRARDDLRAAIRRINRTATELFMETFEAIRGNFRETFRRLFEGGECDVWLTDPDDPLESPIEIHASPRGKRTQRIDLLSGGERALTALSLLFGIYLVKPSPFCVLDEVDAPLDESNIGRFVRLLEEFKEGTQFVVITHNPRTIEAADWIYGVTMEEPGVSTVVGVRLEEALRASGSAA